MCEDAWKASTPVLSSWRLLVCLIVKLDKKWMKTALKLNNIWNKSETKSGQALNKNWIKTRQKVDQIWT